MVTIRNNAQKDSNDVSTLTGVSSEDGQTVVAVSVDPTTGRVLVDTSGSFPNPMTATGDMIYSSDNSGDPARLGIGSNGQVLTSNGSTPYWNNPSAGSGTVTSVSVVTANGVSGVVANPTTTPAITLSLGAITPTSVNAIVFTGSSTPTLSVTGASSISGTNTGDSGTVTSVSVVSANGISGTVANASSTPAITLSLGAITPTTVNAVTISGTSTPTLAVSGTTTVLGSNTGDQTITLTGGVTGSGTGSFAATVQNITTPSMSLGSDANYDMYYRGTNGALARLPNGTTGQVLTATTSATPSWAAAAAAGANTSLSNLSAVAVNASLIPATAGTVSLGSSASPYQYIYTNAKFDINNPITTSSGYATVPVTYRLSTITNSSATPYVITMSTPSAVDGQFTAVRIYDATSAVQNITWIGTENSSIVAPPASNGVTNSPLAVLFQFNGQTNLFRCLESV
jgi:hypothetical protein